MVNKIITSVIIAILAGILAPESTSAGEKLGLIIVAHGSPRPEWNTPVLNIEKEVKSILSERGDNPFSQIRVALMEFCEPSINTVINGFEDDGMDKVYVVPLFIAPSGHSLFDVPTILGLYSDRETLETLKEEGAAIADTRIKITVGPTLNTGNVLKEILLTRVMELSTEPESEAVVLLAHGDESFEPIWSSMCREIGAYVCSETGIPYFDYAFVEIGQSFISEGVPIILEAAGKHQKTIVVGIYLSMGVHNMAQNSTLDCGKMKIASRELFSDKNVHFAERGLLPDGRISDWIVDRALEWVEGLK